MNCKRPDRDFPELICGYPLPCPWHTVRIHLGKTPPTVEIPATASKIVRHKTLQRLKQIARILSE